MPPKHIGPTAALPTTGNPVLLKAVARKIKATNLKNLNDETIAYRIAIGYPLFIYKNDPQDATENCPLAFTHYDSETTTDPNNVTCIGVAVTSVLCTEEIGDAIKSRIMFTYCAYGPVLLAHAELTNPNTYVGQKFKLAIKNGILAGDVEEWEAPHNLHEAASRFQNFAEPADADKACFMLMDVSDQHRYNDGGMFFFYGAGNVD